MISCRKEDAYYPHEITSGRVTRRNQFSVDGGWVPRYAVASYTIPPEIQTPEIHTPEKTGGAVFSRGKINQKSGVWISGGGVNPPPPPKSTSKMRGVDFGGVTPAFRHQI